MKLVALPVSDSSEETLESAEEEGEHSMEANCTAVLHHGETIMPAEDVCYLLTFDDDRWESIFPIIDASATDAIAFFTQHVPTDFKEDTHYLKLIVSGEDIVPVAEHAGHKEGEESKPWGTTILAAVLLINLVTFLGLVFALPFISGILFKQADPTCSYAAFASFAARAILSCAFFLLLFEATRLIAEGWDEENEVIWRWGTMILLGTMILPVVIVESLVGWHIPS